MRHFKVENDQFHRIIFQPRNYIGKYDRRISPSNAAICMAKHNFQILVVVIVALAYVKKECSVSYVKSILQRRLV
eukprot:CAMPEP_0194111390 /NCGR_PEP_ID=MMETSP0150-20130528/10402_1 /TAXON_ID=122233 /ORGANISM="Chaetoceros debilis, Strain MM31A-1" /LENGTH=74 /DNA_ID=CAMNT_0038800805 /DNA_START=81 /DNA_END=302 /DNA_ORIENTATION=+